MKLKILGCFVCLFAQSALAFGEQTIPKVISQHKQRTTSSPRNKKHPRAKEDRVTNIHVYPSTVYTDSEFTFTWNTNLKGAKLLSAWIQVQTPSFHHPGCYATEQSASHTNRNGKMSAFFEPSIYSESELYSGRTILEIKEEYITHTHKRWMLTTEVEFRINSKP
jgi:hypothetical protein